LLDDSAAQRAGETGDVMRGATASLDGGVGFALAKLKQINNLREQTPTLAHTASRARG